MFAWAEGYEPGQKKTECEFERHRDRNVNDRDKERVPERSGPEHVNIIPETDVSGDASP